MAQKVRYFKNELWEYITTWLTGLKSVLTKHIIHKDLVEADINLIKSLILEKIKSNQI